jgi:hypothetical protein
MAPPSAPHRRRCCAMRDSNNARGPRDFGDRATNADRSGSTPLTGANSTPTPTEFRRQPSEGGLRVFDSLRGCHFAVEAHRDVQRIGNAQAAGANPAIGTRQALQALTAERPSRKREVDRATRSWGTIQGSLTQRDRDPPFKRSDAGAIPARPTNLPVTHRQRCARLVSGRGEVQVLSRAPIMGS